MKIPPPKPPPMRQQKQPSPAFGVMMVMTAALIFGIWIGINIH